ncbi:MAG TPA: chromate efflux transporter [Candidatus Didemnitutus sp.]|nr:chromate efflux transporter [Candidatus Didemnitutus sp.]
MSPPRPTLAEIFLTALRLGCTSFGGPVAHLAYFRREYVEKRHWLDEAHYADLVALCQFLPGPASSQVGFGVGVLQRGLAGGLAAWLGFTLPSAALMIAFGCGIAALGDLAHAGWLQGLKVAAVAIVAQAVFAMWRMLCPDVRRSFLAAAAAGVLLFVTEAWTQIAVIGVGTLGGLLFLRSRNQPNRGGTEELSRGKSDSALPSFRVSAICLGLFFLLLVGLPILSRAAGVDWLAVADKFYRTGALVFGGGHVVLPLLEREVVAPGWLTHDRFLAGYGAAQAMPGPLFSFSGYLGAVITPGWRGVAGGMWSLLWIYVPALLVVLGVLPYWQRLRANPAAQAALRGANAAVVGLLLAALITPVASTALLSSRHMVLATAAFGVLLFPKTPPWSVVLACALIGAAWL